MPVNKPSEPTTPSTTEDYRRALDMATQALEVQSAAMERLRAELAAAKLTIEERDARLYSACAGLRRTEDELATLKANYSKEVEANVKARVATECKTADEIIMGLEEMNRKACARADAAEQEVGALRAELAEVRKEANRYRIAGKENAERADAAEAEAQRLQAIVTERGDRLNAQAREVAAALERLQEAEDQLHLARRSNLTLTTLVADRETVCAKLRADLADMERQRDQLSERAPDYGEERLAVVEGYEELARVLDLALEQAQAGKGKERHASGEAFEDQPIVQIAEWLGSAQGCLFQAIKKLRESVRFLDGTSEGRQRFNREVLGAINYGAAAVIVEERKADRKVERVVMTLRPQERVEVTTPMEAKVAVCKGCGAKLGEFSHALHHCPADTPPPGEVKACRFEWRSGAGRPLKCTKPAGHRDGCSATSEVCGIPMAGDDRSCVLPFGHTGKCAPE